MTTNKLAVLVVIALFINGCAVFNRENTPILNAFEKYCVPEDKTFRIISSPVIIPTGLVAVSIDALVVHPISVVDDAADDTVDLLWDNINWDKKYVTECASIAPRIVCSPIILTGDFLGRSLFDIDGRHKRYHDDEEKNRLQKKLEEAENYMASAEDLFLKNQFDAAQEKVTLALSLNPANQKALKLKIRILIASAKHPQARDHLRAYNNYLCDKEIADDILWQLNKHGKSSMQMLLLLEESSINLARNKVCDDMAIRYIKEGLEPLLLSEDRAIVLQTVRAIGAFRNDYAREVLKKIVNENDPVLSSIAEMLIHRYR
ncbi:MAG: hypothetical protein KJ826_09550 [Proteobacteria bacterium]|nr:hypothetical protein [Pseudomonadota bacterium]